MAQLSNIEYAKTFLGDIETLQTRHSDSLDFYNVHVLAVVSMVKRIVADRGETISDLQVSVLLHNHGWEGETVPQLSDRLDFHDMSIWQISKIIKAAREF